MINDPAGSVRKVHMRRFGKITLTLMLMLAVLATAGSTRSVQACTGIYVGSKVSDDGTIMIARSNDTEGVYGNHVVVTEHMDNSPGRKMQVDMDGKVFAEIPATTYKYTATPLLQSAMASSGLPSDASCGANEYGVTMTMSVTAFAHDDAVAADPLVDDGLTENTAVDLVMCQSKSAREAVEVLLGFVDKYGSREGSVVLITDPEEAWYVEMYTGYQYAAVRLPDDKVCVFGNEFSLEYLSDYSETIISKDLESLPKKHGFAVYGRNNEMNLYDTYSGEVVTTDYCHMRTWMGHRLLAPAVFTDDYDASARYPLCFDPEHPVSVADCCTIMRNRFEGTKYDPDTTGREDMRVIGSDTARSVHILQVYPNLPAKMSAIIWECTGPAIYGMFVPVSNAAVSVSEPYGRDEAPNDNCVMDTEHYPYYAFKQLNTLCVGPDNYKIYGAPVRDHWENAEKKVFDTMQKVLLRASQMKDEDDAAAYITAYCNSVQEQAFDDAKKLVDQVLWTQSAHCNTIKLARDPDPKHHRLLNTLRVLPPMEVKLDTSVYEKIPDMTQTKNKGYN